MSRIVFCVLLLNVAEASMRNAVSYKGYLVYKVSEKGFRIPKLKIPEYEERLSVLKEHHEFDDRNNPYTVRSYLIPKSQEKPFLHVLHSVGADYDILSRDLEKEIEEERKSLEAVKEMNSGGTGDVGQRYLSFAEMSNFLTGMSRIKHPDTGMPLAIIEPIGYSLHGRQMHLVKISSDHLAEKPIIFIEAGIHAREWTAPAAALYAIRQLVENYTVTRTALDDIDYYIIPLSNPDGYEFSRTQDRMWRKTRSYYRGRYGVDGNRNFDFHWGERGTSSDPGSGIFKGPFPFSEAETRNIRDAGRKYKKRISAFVSVHAFGPSIAYPWGYKKTKSAPQSDVMRQIAANAVEAIRSYSGTCYKYGVTSVLLYEAAGGSDDYFKGVLGVDLSFTIELSSAQRNSFIIPAGDIQGIVSEAFLGFMVIADGASEYHKSQTLGREDYGRRI